MEITGSIPVRPTSNVDCGLWISDWEISDGGFESRNEVVDWRFKNQLTNPHAEIRHPQFLVGVAQLAERRVVIPEARVRVPPLTPVGLLRGGVIGNTPDSDSGD